MSTTKREEPSTEDPTDTSAAQLCESAVKRPSVLMDAALAKNGRSPGYTCLQTTTPRLCGDDPGNHEERTRSRAVAWADYSNGHGVSAWGAIALIERSDHRGKRELTVQLCGELSDSSGEPGAQLACAQALMALGVQQAILHCDEENAARQLGIKHAQRLTPCAVRAHIAANNARWAALRSLHGHEQAAQLARQRQLRESSTGLDDLLCPPGKMTPDQYAQARRAAAGKGWLELKQWVSDIRQQEGRRRAEEMPAPEVWHLQEAKDKTSSLQVKLTQRPGEPKVLTILVGNQAIGMAPLPVSTRPEHLRASIRLALNSIENIDETKIEQLRLAVARALAQPRPQQLGRSWRIEELTP